MLSLVTGLPGHGKTLFTLQTVRDRARSEGRTVYVYGIPELALDWIPLERAEDWFTCPEGSIIVIDESQKIFPTRSPSAPVPQKCSEFETHRHKGLDIYLITQDRMLIDHHVRRLVGQHYHVRRPFGMKRALVMEFQKETDPNDYHASKEGTKKLWTYPKDLFHLYKSATIHTHKAKLPKKLLLLPIGAVMVAFLFYTAWNTLMGMGGVIEEVRPGSDVVKAIEGMETGTTTARVERQMTRDQYLARLMPRIEGLPHTAPVYDSVRPVRSYPKLVCTALVDRCFCYTQQATKWYVEDSLCRQFAEHGTGFDYSIPDSEQPNRDEPHREGSGRLEMAVIP